MKCVAYGFLVCCLVIDVHKYKKKYLSKSRPMKEEYLLKKNIKLRTNIKKKYLNKKNA